MDNKDAGDPLLLHITPRQNSKKLSVEAPWSAERWRREEQMEFPSPTTDKPQRHVQTRKANKSTKNFFNELLRCVVIEREISFVFSRNSKCFLSFS
jgi:hypothetical protein